MLGRRKFSTRYCHVITIDSIIVVVSAIAVVVVANCVVVIVKRNFDIVVVAFAFSGDLFILRVWC